MAIIGRPAAVIVVLSDFRPMNDLIPGARVQGKVEIDGNPIYGPTVDVVALRKKDRDGSFRSRIPSRCPFTIILLSAPGSMEYQ